MEFTDILWMIASVLGACLALTIVYGLMIIGIVYGIVTNTVLFLFENWVFQAAFGAWVVFALQQVHQKSVQQSDLFQKRYEQKLVAIQSFFGLVDKRIYASRAYLATLRAPQQDESWVAERERYRDAVREWNEKAPGVLVTMLTLLPARMCYQLERDTFLPFAHSDQLLGTIRRARLNGTESQNTIFGTRDILAELVENSNISLAEFLNLAKEERKFLNQEPAISERNLPNLSLGYLVASLFKPSIN